MKVLVLGGNGMLGHQLVRSLGNRHDVRPTLRSGPDAYRHISGDMTKNAYFRVDAADFATVKNVATDFRPEAIVNAVGIVKQREVAGNRDLLHAINATFPQRLADLVTEIGARLVHISTDCVFSGKKGMYVETDVPDPVDDYGRSKLAGEISGESCITLRTSMIGLELSEKKSLIEWFLAQRGPIKGFRRAIFSGFTTAELANIIEWVLVDHPEKQGLYHVSSAAIDKFTLLTMLRDRLASDIEIRPDDEFVCDRSLDSSRFRAEFDYAPPPWDRMLDELTVQIRARRT